MVAWTVRLLTRGQVIVLLAVASIALVIAACGDDKTPAPETPASTVGSAPTAMPATPAMTPVPTATIAPQPTAAPVPTATVAPQPTAAPVPTATVAPQPTAAPVPTATIAPQPTAAPIPVATQRPAATAPATPVATATAADTPAAVTAQPTRTPVTGPVQASNMPFPTPPPSPVPDPTATPESAAKVIDLAREKMEDAGSFAFEVSIDLNLVQDGRTSNIPITYVGDARDDGYSSNRVTVGTPNGTVELRVIIHTSYVHVLDESTDVWRVDDSESPYFLDIGALFGFTSGVPADLELTGQELVDGVEIHRVEGKLFGLDFLGARGDLDVVYWIGTEDGLVREVSAFGQLELDDDTTLIGDITGEKASVNLTGKLFDHGKHVAFSTPTLTNPRFGHDAVLLDDGRVLVGGGFTGFANNNVIVPFPLGLVQLYEPKTGMWSMLEPVEGPGIGYSSIKLIDGKILFVGLEESEDQAVGMASVFDPVSDAWTPLPGSSLPRAFPSLALLDDGRVLVVGGLDVSGTAPPFSRPEVVNEVEILDLNTGDWQLVAPMNRALRVQWLFSLNDGRVMALGGLWDESPGPTTHAEVYDPAFDMWRPIVVLEPNFVPADAIKLTDGRLLVVGVLSGYDVQYPEARIYDPATDTWTPGGQMAHARPSATLALLPDGRVLVAGGEAGWGEGFPPYSTTSVFDPDTLSWSVGPDLAELRAGASATLLHDGRILLAGGIGMALDIEELYPLASSEEVHPNSPGTGAPAATSRQLPFSGCGPHILPTPSAILPPMEAPPPPQSILNAAAEAMGKVDSYHMEVAQDITLDADEEENVTIRLVIDSQSPERLQICGSQTDSSGMFESQIVIIGAVEYTASTYSSEWEIDEFSIEGLDFLDFTSEKVLSTIKEPYVAGLEILNDVMVHRVTGTMTAASLGSISLLGDDSMTGKGELKVVYWIGVDDSLVRRFVAEGYLELFGVEGVDLVMSVEVSDFGEVRVEAPVTGVPLDT